MHRRNNERSLSTTLSEICLCLTLVNHGLNRKASPTDSPTGESSSLSLKAQLIHKIKLMYHLDLCYLFQIGYPNLRRIAKITAIYRMTSTRSCITATSFSAKTVKTRYKLASIPKCIWARLKDFQL